MPGANIGRRSLFSRARFKFRGLCRVNEQHIDGQTSEGSYAKRVMAREAYIRSTSPPPPSKDRTGRVHLRKQWPILQGVQWPHRRSKPSHLEHIGACNRPAFWVARICSDLSRFGTRMGRLRSEVLHTCLDIPSKSVPWRSYCQICAPFAC